MLSYSAVQSTDCLMRGRSVYDMSDTCAHGVETKIQILKSLKSSVPHCTIALRHAQGHTSLTHRDHPPGSWFSGQTHKPTNCQALVLSYSVSADCRTVERSVLPACTLYLGEEDTTTKAVDGGVVHEVPDPLPNEVVLALVDLRGLDQLLLDRRRPPPVDHVPAAL